MEGTGTLCIRSIIIIDGNSPAASPCRRPTYPWTLPGRTRWASRARGCTARCRAAPAAQSPSRTAIWRSPPDSGSRLKVLMFLEDNSRVSNQSVMECRTVIFHPKSPQNEFFRQRSRCSKVQSSSSTKGKLSHLNQVISHLGTIFRQTYEFVQISIDMWHKEALKFE